MLISNITNPMHSWCKTIGTQKTIWKWGHEKKLQILKSINWTTGQVCSEWSLGKWKDWEVMPLVSRQQFFLISHQLLQDNQWALLVHWIVLPRLRAFTNFSFSSTKTPKASQSLDDANLDKIRWITSIGASRSPTSQALVPGKISSSCKARSSQESHWS